MTFQISADRSTAVDYNYYWRPIDTCPYSVKVQLLGKYGVAVYGTYHGTDPYWVGWAPLPKVPDSMKDSQ